MDLKSMQNPNLPQLLAQLVHVFRANETKIPAENISQCLDHLSPGETSTLHRLFCLLFMSKSCASEEIRKGDATSNSSGTTHVYRPERVSDAPSTLQTLSHQDSLTAWSCCDELGFEQNCENGENDPASPSAFSTVSMVSGVNHGPHTAVPTSGEASNRYRSYSGPNSNLNLAPQSTIQVARHSSTTQPIPPQIPSAPVGFDLDDDFFRKIGLSFCTQLTFEPSTKDLLEQCKTNRGRFLKAIKDAKATFPTGQGWEAAIATKKENADIRDLMKIFHRFECHNIYRHVVEAGYHTGTHWIRDMRIELANKLCQRFPMRFQDQKSADRTLSWVDQGCRYDKWAGAFSDVPDFGYLIALPPDISHSAYTSRCTREQMTTAALGLKKLGIDDLVKSLELSELANHIATELREMTGRKRNEPDDVLDRDSRKSPRLTTASTSPSFGMQSGQNPTPPALLATDNNPFNLEGCCSTVYDCAGYDSFNTEHLFSSHETPILDLDNWGQNVDFMNDVPQMRMSSPVHQCSSLFVQSTH